MPIQAVVTVTKPQGAVFFNESSPENAAKAAETEAWIKTLPGLISRVRETIDENTKVVTTIWEGAEAYKFYYASKFTHEDHTAKRAYNEANGIVTTSVDTVID